RQKLQSEIADEMQKNGFTNLVTSQLGAAIVFSRRPVRNMAELRATPLWVYDTEKTLVMSLREMGVNVVPLPLDQAGPAYEAGKHDGFVALPGAALGFQWSVQARHFTP